MGSGITRLLRPNQGSDLLHGLKISYHNIFPHNKVCVHRISWPRYITYSCFRLAAVPVIRSTGCLTKKWYHILNLLIVEGTVIYLKSLFSLCNATPQRAVNARRQWNWEKAIYTYLFWREMGRRKRTKRNPVTEKVRKYFLDWFTSDKGPSIEFLGRSNITIPLIPPGQ